MNNTSRSRRVTTAIFAVLLLIPISDWAVAKVSSQRPLSPDDDGFGIHQVWLSGDEGTAVVTASRPLPGRWMEEWEKQRYGVFLVDLQTGSWESASDPGLCIERYSEEGELESLAVADTNCRQTGQIDPESGSYSERDGSQFVWPTTRRAGLGLRAKTGPQHELFDPARGRGYVLEDLLPKERAGNAQVFVRPGLWLVYEKSNRAGARPFSSLDPETGTLTELDWPAPGRQSRFPMLADGRVFLVIDGGLYLGDTQGELLRIECESEIEGRLGRVGSWPRPFQEGEPIRLRNGNELLEVDLESHSARPLGLADERLLDHWGEFSDGSALVIESDRKTLIRLAPGGETQAVFPRVDG